MATDRELLEAAAKAAGKEHYGEYNAHAGLKTTGGWWNPLTDDGDALRLAVKLNIYVYPRQGKTHCEWRTDGEQTGEMYTQPHGTDPYAATRRAIVRAAAEIGRSMK
jgi:hypothetical protein